ncbi:MAG: glycosyltransferase [Novosphingobium sp.]|nr:MAG: glycosyltransferase [Novosphingobium sp.]
MNRNENLVRDQVFIHSAARRGDRLLVKLHVPDELQRLFVARAVVDGIAAVVSPIGRSENTVLLAMRCPSTSANPTFELWSPGRNTPLRTARDGIAWIDFDTLHDSVTLTPPMSETRARRLAKAAATTGLVGRMEALRGDALIGWAFDHDDPGARVVVDIFVDGLWRASTIADQPRGDLRNRGIGDGAHAFHWPLPDDLIGRAFEDFSALPSNGYRPLPKPASYAAGLSAAAPSGPADGPFARALDAQVLRRVPVAIVVPIFNAVEATARCIAALLDHTSTPAELILIDDASSDPRMASLLAQFEGLANVRVLRNVENLGFTRTVNRGIAAAGRADVVLLNSDTRVGPRWLESLRLAAHRSARTASATAVSDNAGAFSIPLPERESAHDPADDLVIARQVAQTARALWPEAPTGHGFCMYIRRDCLDDVGLLDDAAFPRGYGEENDLSMRAVRRGWTHVVDDRTLVFHERSASFGDEKTELMTAGRKVIDHRYPDYTSKVRAFIGGPGLRAIKAAAEDGFASTDRAPARPRILFVINKETGGTPQTNRDLMSAIDDEYDPFILRFDRRTLFLERPAGAENEVLTQHSLATPIDPLSHRSGEYDRVVASWLTQYAIELVHVRHIGWHSFGLFRVADDLSIPVVFSFHDFYAVCPSLKLLDHSLNFCGGVCTLAEGSCVPELWDEFDLPPLRDDWVYTWRAQMAEALKGCEAFVTTSPFAKQLLIARLPSLAERRFPVIEHGRDFTQFLQAAQPLKPLSPLRIVVPGNIGIPKGARLIRDVKRLDVDGRLEFHILGLCHEMLVGADVVLHGAFDREEIVERIAALQPNVGGIFSIWPETYCHTLTELWAAGVPTVAFDVGALGERIRDHGGGWLLTDTAPEAVYRALLAIADDQQGAADKVAEIGRWQQNAGAEYGVAAMAARYTALYRDVAATRQYLRAPSPSQAHEMDPLDVV